MIARISRPQPFTIAARGRRRLRGGTGGGIQGLVLSRRRKNLAQWSKALLAQPRGPSKSPLRAAKAPCASRGRHDACAKRTPKPRHTRKQGRRACSGQPPAFHRILDHGIEGFAPAALIDIMLVLPDPMGLRRDLPPIPPSGSCNRRAMGYRAAPPPPSAADTSRSGNSLPASSEGRINRCGPPRNDHAGRGACWLAQD